MRFKFILICSFCMICSLLNSVTWEIKQDGTGDFTTIQAGIDASADADTVLVYPGTYYENINYNGKSLTIASLEMITGDEQYISQTIIDGQRQTSCVSLVSGETNTVLRGFTITNGRGEVDHPFYGGGISIYGDYPEVIEIDIINCIITKNYSDNTTGGIRIVDGIVFLSGCSIRQNHAARFGGGIGICGQSQVTFDQVNRCSIYDNFAGSGLDIYIETIYFDELDVFVDTFTVAEPDIYFAQKFHGNYSFEYNFDILNYIIEPVEHDLYVSPNGNDNNSGLTPNDPLKTINLAVRKIASNPEQPHTVYLAEGTYNNSDNQQIFAFGCKANVNIIGADMNTTIIDGENEYVPLFSTAQGYFNSTIKDITFQNAIYEYTILEIYYSDNIKFENILIADCTITDKGVGLAGSTASGNVELINVKADNIEVFDLGHSGVWINGTTSFRATNCTFSNNVCTGDTGISAGLSAMSNGDIYIENCKFFNNTAIGNMWYGYASALLTTDYNNEIGNTYINNNLFYNNHISNGRSTVYAASEPTSIVEFTNNTLIDNISDYGVGIKGNMYCQNNILRNPGEYEIGLFYDTFFNASSNLYASYNNIEGGETAIYSDNGANSINWQEGNIDEDPLFLLSGDDPYQLTELSPCIDTGIPDTTGLYLPPWDLIGNQRIWDGDGNGDPVIDMGCYEFGSESASGYITGHVYDTNGEPVENAEISAGEFFTYTDYQGSYTMEVYVDSYDVMCYHEDYNLIIEHDVVVELGETIMLNFLLEFLVNADDIIHTKEISLSNFPNPFNPSTTISYNIPESGNVNLAIYNIKGQRVRRLIDAQLSSGHYTIVWDGKNDSGKTVSSGIYFYQLQIDGTPIASRKMLLVK